MQVPRQLQGYVRVTGRDAPHSLDIPVELQQKERLFVPDAGLAECAEFHGRNGKAYLFPVRVPGSSSDSEEAARYRTTNSHLSIIAYVNKPPPLSDRHRMFMAQVDGRPAMGLLSYTYLEKLERPVVLQEIRGLRVSEAFMSGLHFVTGIKKKRAVHLSDEVILEILSEPEIRSVMAYSPATGAVVFVDESVKK